jgi:hypothetical protein
MAKTLLTHWTGLLNWWAYAISSAKMEGTNNKIKTLTRQAHGYRDEDFFILAIRYDRLAAYKKLLPRHPTPRPHRTGRRKPRPQSRASAREQFSLEGAV